MQMQVRHYLGWLDRAEQQLAEAFRVVADRHYNDYEIREMCTTFAEWSYGHRQVLEPYLEQYGKEQQALGPEQLRASLFQGARAGGLGLLHDLQDLSLLANATRTLYTILHQGAIELRDTSFEETLSTLGDQTNRQLDWLCGRIKQNAPQVLTVPPDPASEARASLPKQPNAAAIPDQLWAPVMAAGLSLFVGLAGLLAGQPWLLPSLGPTAYLQVESPAHPRSRFYNTVVGHLVGLLAGFGAVALFNAWNEPVTLVDRTLTAPRLGASVLALALTILVAFLLRASHPPAGATTLLVTLGSLSTLADGLNLMLGVLLIAAAGEVIRRLRLGKLSAVEVTPRLPANVGR
jgi:hypothetical protein